MLVSLLTVPRTLRAKNGDSGATLGFPSGGSWCSHPGTGNNVDSVWARKGEYLGAARSSLPRGPSLTVGYCHRCVVNTIYLFPTTRPIHTFLG